MRRPRPANGFGGPVDQTHVFDVDRPAFAPAEPFDAAAGYTGPLPVVPPGAAVDGVLLGVARRMRSQASRQAALAERLRAAESRPGPLADLAELAAIARRTRRDGDTLLVLAGAEPVRRSAGPVSLDQLLGEVLAGVEDASRVIVSESVDAVLDPVPADGLVLALAELIAHAAATTAPGARIDVASRPAADGGVAVEVLVAGLGLPAEEADELEYRLDDPSAPVPAGEQVGLFVAARLARRSGLRLGLHPDAEHVPAPGLALVAAVYCPPPGAAPHRGGAGMVAHRGAGLDEFGTGAYAPVLRSARPAPGDPADLPLFAAASAAVGPSGDDGTDALFGPLAAGALLSGDDEWVNPIYAEVATAWFRSGEHGPAAGPGTDDWGTAGEWQAAAQRFAQPDEVTLTSSGLPQRRPGRQMVPPPRGAVAGVGVGASAERAPDRVRMRLSSYQRGLQEGRHRAADEDPDLFGSPED